MADLGGGPFSKMWPPLNGHMDLHSSSGSCCCLPDEIWAHRPSAGADLVYLSFWMGTTLETVTKFRAFGGSSRTNSGFVLLSPGQNLGTPAFGGGRKSRKSTGALEMASGKGAGSTKSTNFRLLWGSFISAVPEAGFPGNPQLPCHVKFCHKIKGLEHILGRFRGGPFSKMWPPLNGHMDSHSSSFSGATHKERPGLPRKG